MCDICNNFTEAEMAEAMTYLYRTAQIKYPTLSPWHDDLVEEVLLRVLINRQKGVEVTYGKGYLTGILTHVCNDMLRQKYRNQIIHDAEIRTVTEPGSEEMPDLAEYAALRQQVSRLTHLYREVTVRHYFLGHPVERIARELGIPKGTVLSRLSKARDTIRKGLETPMEKFTEASYAPKSLRIGIWGNQSMHGAPFSLVKGLLEQNVLITAYEKPLSLREIGDRMGVACAYLEPICDALVEGELMGRTAGGLLYTRCFLHTEAEAFGDIESKEAQARELAAPIWEALKETIVPFLDSSPCASWSDKQKATLVLLKLLQVLHNIQSTLEDPAVPDTPMERPDGGRWFASGTIFEKDSPDSSKYDKYRMSGPVQCSFSPKNDGRLAWYVEDCASVFGIAHWGYGSLPVPFRYNEISQLYASLANPGISLPNVQILENLPRLEELYLVRRKEEAGWELDIPYLTFADYAVFRKDLEALEERLTELLKPAFIKLQQAHVNKIPPYVDGIPYYRHMGALLAYNPAQLAALLPYLPWQVELWKTPLVCLLYDPDASC